MNKSLTFTRIYPGEDWSPALEVRFPVFMGEQGFSFDIDAWDGLAYHVIGYRDGRPVGTARLLPEGEVCRIGRVAVLGECRGLGLGRLLMEEACSFALELGCHSAYVHAQIPRAGFYEACGFHPAGSPFDEDGMPHIYMSREL